MGLDQNLYLREKVEQTEIGEWRKFNALQNYIEKNFGYDEDINCKDIVLSKEAINDLLVILHKVSKDHSLAHELFPCTFGFFYGSQEYDDLYFEDIDRSIDIFEKALESIEKNDVIYSCWY